MTTNTISVGDNATGSKARSCDVLVIGAGPAGLAAATLAAQHGADAVLLDEQPAPGGQIYRAITTTPVQNRDVLGADYWHGETLLAPLAASGARHVPQATVWAVSQISEESNDGFEVAYSINNQPQLITARQLILATGAHERPFPIPGWTLPGVITAGAAQILLKTSAVVPDGRTVLAGCGPLLYLIAWQYLNAGVRVDALLDTAPAGNLARALPHAPGFLASPYLAKGIKLLRAVKAAIPVVKHVTELHALGDEKLASVRYTARGQTRDIPADQLLLHQGVVPNVNLARALGVIHDWNARLDCWEPKVDDWGASSVPGVLIAGDGAGIAGALAAEHRGRLAALAALHALDRIDGTRREQLARHPRQQLARAQRGRAFFDALYQTAPQYRRPTGDTLVCRCEEVTAAQIRATVKLGCPGPNQMKSFLRCGMGPCQGRFCGLTVSEVIADERGVPVSDIDYYRLRFPTKPLTLGELAALPQTNAQTDAARAAVVRI